MLNAKCALESHVPVLIQVETVAKEIFHDSRNPHAHLGPWKHYRYVPVSIKDTCLRSNFLASIMHMPI